MILNIETQNTTEVVDALSRIYINHRVQLLYNFGKTADFEILNPNKPANAQVYTLEGLFEVMRYLNLNAYQIRVR